MLLKLLALLIAVAFSGCGRQNQTMSRSLSDEGQHPANWPESWEGNSVIDCGRDGRMALKILLLGTPSVKHEENYQQILDRWSDLWPQVRNVIQKMFVEYERDYQIPSRGLSLHFTIPEESISSGAHWSVAILTDSNDGVWDTAFHGWEISPEDSQPVF